MLFLLIHKMMNSVNVDEMINGKATGVYSATDRDRDRGKRIEESTDVYVLYTIQTALYVATFR